MTGEEELVELLQDWKVAFTMRNGRIALQVEKKERPFTVYTYTMYHDEDTIYTLIGRAHSGEPPKF
jgi:hypothetical protein